MRLYLDDDSINPKLAQLLREAGHDVRLPAQLELDGSPDAVHLTQAIFENRVLLSKNYEDFDNLHLLILRAQGHHPGILVARRDNQRKHNLLPRDIVRAIDNILAAGIPLADQYIILNPWR